MSGPNVLLYSHARAITFVKPNMHYPRNRLGTLYPAVISNVVSKRHRFLCNSQRGNDIKSLNLSQGLNYLQVTAVFHRYLSGNTRKSTETGRYLDYNCADI